MVNDRSNRMYISTEIEAAGLTVMSKLDGEPAICTLCVCVCVCVCVCGVCVCVHVCVWCVCVYDINVHM